MLRVPGHTHARIDRKKWQWSYVPSTDVHESNTVTNMIRKLSILPNKTHQALPYTTSPRNYFQCKALKQTLWWGWLEEWDVMPWAIDLTIMQFEKFLHQIVKDPWSSSLRLIKQSRFFKQMFHNLYRFPWILQACKVKIRIPRFINNFSRQWVPSSKVINFISKVNRFYQATLNMCSQISLVRASQICTCNRTSE